MSDITRIATSISVPRPNASLPVAHSYRATPSEKMSERASMCRPHSCSGDMYPGVPTVLPSTVSRSIVSASARLVTVFAMPKSTTFSCPRGVTMMF